MTKTDSKKPFIQLKNLVKKFQVAEGEFTALKKVDLNISKGEYVGIIGKSGSGKTTLLNMLTGIDRPTSGDIIVDNRMVHTLTESQMAVWRGRSIGIVFQFFQLLPTLTVLENVMLPMDFANTASYLERRKRAMALLEKVGVADQARKLPSALSGGQQQRVAIARALANDPPILAADEPTGNLDSHTAEVVFEIFDNLVKEGKTVIVITHDKEISKRVHRSITISDGLIVEDTKPVIDGVTA
ncbi:MAG: ABC transporter ATP-binding protein [Clostridia bacterium]|nr:ABC transporter ATP-binding protein [Clostridia bacterium]